MSITKKQIHIFIAWTAAILWMMLIFYFSSQIADQSSELSTGVTQLIIEFINKILPRANFNIETFNYIVRKNAHFVVYLILGILVANALKKSGVVGYKGIVWALIICILYAISDEIHQLYVPGRAGQIKDVVIDSLGAMVGIRLWCLAPPNLGY